MINQTSRPALTPADYQAFHDYLERSSGILLGKGKEYLVASRLGNLLKESRYETFGELINALVRGGDMRLKTAVVDAMTTNETFWFRDGAHYRILTDSILKNFTGNRLRIWSAACSSGQEPYSISMVLDEQMRKVMSRRINYEIVATDISRTVLEEARKGVYCGLAASRGLVGDQRQRYFIPKGDCLEVKPELRRPISFRELNLTQSYDQLGKFDVIFCRNVLIYFSADLKNDILRRMARALNPGGYLFLGSTEAPSSLAQYFEMQSTMGGIVYRRKDN